MSEISAIVSWAPGSIEPQVLLAPFSAMKHGAVSYLCPSMERLVTHYCTVSVMVIRIWFKNLQLIGRGGKRNNIVYMVNIYGSWKRIRGIMGYFVQVGDIINGNGRDIQIWYTRINWKGIIESVINCYIVLFSNWGGLLLALNSMTE